MQYALAASSSPGYTIVWDLRGKRKVAGLTYGGGGGTMGGMLAIGGAGLPRTKACSGWRRVSSTRSSLHAWDGADADHARIVALVPGGRGASMAAD